MNPRTAYFPDAQALLSLIKSRVEDRRAIGIVLGVLEADATRQIVAYGDQGPGALPLGPESVFEIGSITKVFTGILLADMAARGEVDMNAPVRRYAPVGLTMPTRDGREITLADLATQNSGLPSLPGNLRPLNPANPYAGYSVAEMYAFLAGYQLPYAIGSVYEYSNLAMGLLGYVLANRAGVDYETLVRTRILDPLGMTMTGIALSPSMSTHLAIGHDVEGNPTALWELPAFAGAGALRSNVNDMLTFLEANIGEPRSDLERAMRVSHRPVAASQGMNVGLAWHTLTVGRNAIVFHTGGTRGYRSFVGFDPVRRTGVVLLANSANDADDLAFQLFDRALALIPRQITRTAIDVSSDLLGRYVGEYQYLEQPAKTVTMKFTLEDGILMLDATGREKAQKPMLPASSKG